MFAATFTVPDFVLGLLVGVAVMLVLLWAWGVWLANRSES